MLKTNNDQFEVEVMYFEEWNLCKILKVTGPGKNKFKIDPDTTLMIEEGIDEDDLLDSQAFLDFIKQKYGATDNDSIVVTHGVDDDDEEEVSTGGHVSIEIYTIENSFNFKLLGVIVPGAESSSRKEIEFDQDKIFTHPDENIYNFPLELFEYLEDLSGLNIECMNVLYNYKIAGCRKTQSDEAVLRLRPLWRGSAK